MAKAHRRGLQKPSPSYRHILDLNLYLLLFKVGIDSCCSSHHPAWGLEFLVWEKEDGIDVVHGHHPHGA